MELLNEENNESIERERQRKRFEIEALDAKVYTKKEDFPLIHCTLFHNIHKLFI